MDLKKLFKFLKYLIAYHPEEFGLIPDYNGFFKIKEIFQVLIFTKKFKKVKIETLKQIFSYYYRDFFEFSENSKLVKAKNPVYHPPEQVELSTLFKFNTLWTFVKPKVWWKISLEGWWKPRHQKIVLFADKELAENWAKVKGALLIQAFPYRFPEYIPLLQFGEGIFLIEELPFEALKGPAIDQKFLRKYGPKEIPPKREEPIIPFIESFVDLSEEFEEEEIPYRKITKGKKKRKPWKQIQKQKEREKWD